LRARAAARRCRRGRRRPPCLRGSKRVSRAKPPKQHSSATHGSLLCSCSGQTCLVAHASARPCRRGIGLRWLRA
jgi:hypothetical protein